MLFIRFYFPLQKTAHLTPHEKTGGDYLNEFEPLKTLLSSRVKHATTLGAKTVVLKNAKKETLKCISEGEFKTISNDMNLDFEWYQTIKSLNGLLSVADHFSDSPVVITEWLYVIIKKYAPLFESYFGKVVAVDCGERASIDTGENISDELMPLFDIEGQFISVKDFPETETIPLFERIIPIEVNTLDQLLNHTAGRKCTGIRLDKNLESFLTEAGISLLSGNSNHEVIIVSSPAESVLSEVDREVSMLRAIGREVEVIDFTGYCPGEEARSIDLKNELKEHFGFDSFKEYEVYGKTGNYLVSREELIRYLIDQNYRQDPSDLFFVASTGSGKSLIYQLTAKILKRDLDRLTVVITPLKALMEDQVNGLIERYFENGAAFLNSDLSFDEKSELTQRVRKGEITILYVSPETFVGNSLSSIIGERSIGLLVVDEAHLVTTWGKTFRVDYGYLGEDLRFLRSRLSFPVMATTATAISGGELNTISEISKLLCLKNPKTVMTNVRRDNIKFKIDSFELNQHSKDCRTAQKLSDSIDYAIDLVESGKKSIIYCPFVGQAHNIYNAIADLEECRNKVGRYTGPTETQERRLTQELFRKGIYRTVIATKAFGMGVDIPDIDEVFHHSVPSIMADYVQEIGRAGRDGRPSVASTHFHTKDLSDSLKLSKISVPEQWKMRHIMEHIGTLIRQSKNGEIVLSLDDIRYLLITGKDKYNEETIRDKARVAIFLIQKDLEKKTGKQILIRKGETYQYLYFTASNDDAEELMKSFPEISRESAGYSRKGFFHNEEIRSVGAVYKIDISALWARLYRDRNLRKLVWQFMRFPSKILGKPVIPKIAVEMSVIKDMDSIKQQLTRFIEILGEFALDSARKQMDEKSLFDGIISKVKSASLLTGVQDLDIKIRNIVKNNFVSYNGDRFQTGLFKCRGEIGNYIYTVQNIPNITKDRWLNKLEELLEPCEEGICRLYLNGQDEHTEVITSLLNILDILGMANVKFSGGESCAVHLKCTDRNYILNNFKNYYCEITRDIRRRIDREEQIMRDFFTMKLDDSQRWDFIENYFLGRIY